MFKVVALLINVIDFASFQALSNKLSQNQIVIVLARVWTCVINDIYMHGWLISIDHQRLTNWVYLCRQDLKQICCKWTPLNEP